MGGGATAAAVGEGKPSTGFEGCNPSLRSVQQDAGGTPNGHEVPFSWGIVRLPLGGI